MILNVDGDSVFKTEQALHCTTVHQSYSSLYLKVLFSAKE